MDTKIYTNDDLLYDEDDLRWYKVAKAARIRVAKELNLLIEQNQQQIQWLPPHNWILKKVQIWRTVKRPKIIPDTKHIHVSCPMANIPYGHETWICLVSGII